MMDVDTLKQLIDDAEHGKPDLPEALANFAGGFSAPKVRRLLNALCSQPDTRYLEIGVHTGSTFIPALYGNTSPATCIDNWSLFNGAREQFKKNTERFIPGRKFTALDDDCFVIAPEILPTGITVYFYDGEHSKTAQYQAIVHYAPQMAQRFVLLVDDCNWEEPREETARALRDLGYHVLFNRLLPGAYNGDETGWWNGLYCGLIEK